MENERVDHQWGMLLTQYYGAYAQEIVNFADTAAANGVPLYAFSMQNEPDQSAIYD
jgi:O-glycosyl hydrolase